MFPQTYLEHVFKQVYVLELTSEKHPFRENKSAVPNKCVLKGDVQKTILRSD